MKYSDKTRPSTDQVGIETGRGAGGKNIHMISYIIAEIIALTN